MATKKLKTKIARLEVIADTLEQKDLDLEKALTLFEEGMKLVKECGGDLDTAEEKVMILSAESAGGPLETEIPYEGVGE